MKESHEREINGLSKNYNMFIKKKGLGKTNDYDIELEVFD